MCAQGPRSLLPQVESSVGVSLSGHLCRRGQAGSLWIPGPAPVPAAWPGPEWAGSAPSPQFQPVVSEALPLWSRLAPPLGRAPRECLSRVCSCPLGFADLVPGPSVLSRSPMLLKSACDQCTPLCPPTSNPCTLINIPESQHTHTHTHPSTIFSLLRQGSSKFWVQLRILLPQSLKCWDCMHVQTHSAPVV